MKIDSEIAYLAVDIKRCYEDDKNVNVHPDENIAVLMHSLNIFGQKKSIVGKPDSAKKDAKIRIVAGNGLLRAALRIGAAQIAVVQLTEFSENEIMAYGLVDNRAGNFSYFNPQLLPEAIRNLGMNGADVQGLGFLDRELANYEALLASTNHAQWANEIKPKLDLTQKKFLFLSYDAAELWDAVMQKAQKAGCRNDSDTVFWLIKMTKGKEEQFEQER